MYKVKCSLCGREKKVRWGTLCDKCILDIHNGTYRITKEEERLCRKIYDFTNEYIGNIGAPGNGTYANNGERFITFKWNINNQTSNEIFTTWVDILTDYYKSVKFTRKWDVSYGDSSDECDTLYFVHWRMRPEILVGKSESEEYNKRIYIRLLVD